MYLTTFQYKLGNRTWIPITPISDTRVLHASTATQRVRDDNVTGKAELTIVDATDTTESLQ